MSHAPPRVPKQRRPQDAALPPVSESRLAGSPAWHRLPQCPGCGQWVSYCWLAFVFGSGLRLGVGFVNPCQSWLGSWVGAFGHGLWCCLSFAGCLCCSWLGLGFGLLMGRFACLPPFPVPVCGVGVRAGPGSRLCPALLGWVAGVSFLRFFFSLALWCRLLGVPVPGLVVCPPIPFLSGWAAGFFFSLCDSACFGAPFSGGPLFLAWCCRFWPVVPLCLFGVLSSVPSGWGVPPPFVLLTGGLVAVGCFRAPPPFFFGGGVLPVPPSAFPGLAHALWPVCGAVGSSPLLAEVPVCYSPPLLAGFRCRWGWAFLATPG